MKLIFRLMGMGFCISIADVVEILDNVDFREIAESNTAGARGQIPFRDGQLPVFDLCPWFDLKRPEPYNSLAVLVISTDAGYLGLMVDAVDGIFPGDEFAFKEVPPLLCHVDQAQYRTLAIWREEPVVVCEVFRMSQLGSIHG